MTEESVILEFVKTAREKRESLDEAVTEDAAAIAFAERYGSRLRFDHDVGKWFVWSGQHWQGETTELAFSFARELAREMAKGQAHKTRLASSKTGFAAGVERFARSDRAFAVTSAIWDRNTYLLGTPGGTVDLRTGYLMPAQATDYITKLAAVTPAETAHCPRWKQFLQDATGADTALVDFLQAFAGYMLTGDTKEHSLLFVHGGGGNGKSVLQNTLAGIFADYATSAAMDTFIASTFDKHPTDLAMLRGARLVTASETEEGRAWAESRIKQLTGGDRIRARFMRQDFFEYQPQFKLLLVGNHAPALRNVDDAARRRFNIIPFIHKPPVPDMDLETRLRAEWPGILRWIIDGCLIWQKRGLTRPKVVLDATADYFEEQDSVRQWIEAACDTKATLTDTRANLFRSWSTWANANGEKPGSAKWFVQAMRRHGFHEYRSAKSRGFKGIEARPEPAAKHWNDDQ
jgi:putative DNA primase/helicase